jgi:putative membrane protein
MNKMLHGVATGCLVFATALALAQGKAPNDAQIAGIVVAANTVDINAGELAKTSSQNQQVKDFAQRMVTDHTGVNGQATALVKKLNVTPEESDTSKALKDAGAANITKLKGMKGAAFDTAYIANEVSYHQTVLDAIDKTLIPSAKNAELKGLLEKVRPAIDAHLQHAKQIQASMK